MKMRWWLFLLMIPGLVEAADSGGSAPAAVTKEGDLVVVTLKPDAEEKLRLKVVPVEHKAVPETRLFAGEVVTPLAAPGGGVAPVLGGTLDEVLRLAELQATADGKVTQAEVQVEAARIAVERAEKVLKAQAGSVRSVDEAKSALALAESSLATAKAQRDLLGAPVGRDGGARRAWVRVSIYSGESARLNPEAEASIETLAKEVVAPKAKPVAGPPTADALTNSVDWYYELPGETKLRAGERVAVSIPAKDGEVERLVVPFHAVLHDIHGGQWIYEQTGEHTYTRRRVQVARLSGELAVLTTGPPEGSRVVTDGATELFGTEFMTGK